MTTIRAEVHSDDYIFEVKFDAEPWFEQSDDVEIVALAACGWGGDYPADAVAIATADINTEVAEMFHYLERIADIPSKKDCSGFECYVDAGDAMGWIRTFREELASIVEQINEDPAIFDAEAPGFIAS